MLAVTRNPVDWVFCATVTTGLIVAGARWLRRRRLPDLWREAVLTERARIAGAKRRHRRRQRRAAVLRHR